MRVTLTAVPKILMDCRRMNSLLIISIWASSSLKTQYLLKLPWTCSMIPSSVHQSISILTKNHYGLVELRIWNEGISIYLSMATWSAKLQISLIKNHLISSGHLMLGLKILTRRNGSISKLKRNSTEVISQSLVKKIRHSVVISQ